MELKADENGCEEAMPGFNFYVPCNKPAVKIIGWKNEGPYRMCDMCALHSIKNRNATDMGNYVQREQLK